MLAEFCSAVDTFRRSWSGCLHSFHVERFVLARANVKRSRSCCQKNAGVCGRAVVVAERSPLCPVNKFTDAHFAINRLPVDFDVLAVELKSRGDIKIERGVSGFECRWGDVVNGEFFARGNAF
jgi:hypothetical protein